MWNCDKDQGHGHHKRKRSQDQDLEAARIDLARLELTLHVQHLEIEPEILLTIGTSQNLDLHEFMVSQK